MGFSVLQRRTVAVLHKQTIKIGHVVEARVEANFCNRFFRIQQQLTSKTHPNVDQKLLEAVVRMFPKKMTKRRITHVHQASQVGYFHLVVGKILQDIGLGHLDAATIRF